MNGVCVLMLFLFQDYISAHPETVLLDPLPAMTQLLDRFASYRIINQLQHTLKGLTVTQLCYLAWPIFKPFELCKHCC